MSEKRVKSRKVDTKKEYGYQIECGPGSQPISCRSPVVGIPFSTPLLLRGAPQEGSCSLRQEKKEKEKGEKGVQISMFGEHTFCLSME